MSKNDRSWIPDAVDLDWIESLAPPLPPALAAIEAAAEGPGIPIVDRDAGRVLRGPGRRPAADRRGRHGVRLLDALDGPRPAGRRHDRDDRSRTASGPTSRAAGGARPGSPTSGSPSSTRRRSTAFERRTRRSAGPFDLVFIDALKPEYEAYLEALVGRLAPGALIVADNVLWSGRVVGHAAGRGRRREHGGAAGVRRGGAGRSALHRHDPAGRRRAAHRHLARLSRAGVRRSSGPGPPVRDPARAGRRRARSPLELADGARRRGGLGGARRAPPGPGARPRVAAVRPERRLRRPDDGAGRRRRGGR